MPVQTRNKEVSTTALMLAISIASTFVLVGIGILYQGRNAPTAYTVCIDETSPFDDRSELSDESWYDLLGVNRSEIAPGTYEIKRNWLGTPIGVADITPVAC